jgi:ABC-2 type transport system ATP-binding protein
VTAVATGTPAIAVEGLRKAYGRTEALRGLDLAVHVGEVFALLGPNGAGKTTTVEILEGHRRRDAGTARVLGIDPDGAPLELRRRIGIVLQATGVERYLTVRELLDLHRGYFPAPRSTADLLELSGLSAAADRRVGRLSGGQHRRLDLAVALAGDPELLFLDEPTTGFDPSARRQAWEIVRSLAGLGKTILLTTHHMDEAQALADRVAVISHGRIVAEGTPATLGDRHARSSRVRFGLPAGAELPDRFGARRTRDEYELETESATRLLHELTEWAISADTELVGIEVSQPSLEEVYLELTGETAGR